MAGIGENVAAHVAESLADKAMQELHYLCCYNSYVEDFEDQKKHLKVRRERIQKDIKEAHNRNKNQIEGDVKLWREEADDLIEEDTKGKNKWFGVLPSCFWQYKRGKELEGKTQRIKELIENSKFPFVARSTGLPGVEFYSIENFMQLKDRVSKFRELTEALENDSKFVIGLFGLGGTGKTTMAIEVGKVAESKGFDKVIFSVVSKDRNLKKIRDNIAKHLNLDFKEGTDESEQAQELWKRIAEGGEKVLLILDDVWEELPLEKIGIPRGKSCCSMLLTTRHRGVCSNMGCREPIELEVLSVEDAVNLFLSYADKSTDSSPNDFKDVALGIVKECGRLPVAIVTVARALKSKPLKEWKQGLERLRNPKSIHDVNEDLREAYNSLRLSYDYLKNKEARKLFLLCSLFPDDYEIPIELLTRIAIGMGLCGEANKYSVTRSYFTPIINVLMDSCLLLKVENEAVKMHDLVREVALWIGNNLVQVVMDSSSTLKENIKYSRWNIVDFPSHFDSRKLEVLLLWISNNADSPTIKVPNGIFEGMKNLKFLAIMNWSNIEISCAPLFQSLPSLINIQSLAIKRFELGDISLLGNLKSLESLELSQCSMIELPKEIGELEKLRLLEMVRCDIERNNPFEVIGSCSQLEELYFVSNRMDEDTCESLAQISTFPKLERYHIKARHGFSSYKVDFSISRYFNLEYLRVSFSDEIFKSLAARAEVLKFGRDYDNRGWTNVVPDILPVKDDNMEDPLTRLCLQSMNGITCLIRTERLQLDAGIFSMLVELKLSDIHVRELCCGPYPVDFLKQLEKLHLSRCKNLEGLLFAGKLELCNLKSIHLQECSMACLFQPFTAQSLKQLEMLHIDKCSGLNYIVAKPMEDHDPNQTSHESMLPKLKYLKVRSCPELEFILPIYFCKDLPLLESMEIASCEKLEYILGQYPYERDLHQMGKEAILQSLEELEISRVPNFINLYAEWYLPCPSDKIQKSSPSTDVEGCTSSSSRGHLCCFWPKSNASTIHHPSAFTNHNEEMGKQEFTCLYAIKASKAELDSSAARGFFPAALYQFKLRKFMLTGFSQLTSLFTISIASSLKLLETLKVEECEALQHIITVERPTSHGRQMIVHSPFPRLKEVCIRRCNSLEYVFPAFYSKHFQHLERLSIREAGKMKYVFGKCPADQDHNVHSELALPALKELCLADVLNMVSICAENYYVEVLHLDQIDCEGCPQLPQTLIDFLFGGHNRQDLSRRKALSFKERGKPLSNLRELCDSRDRYVEPKNFLSFQKLSWLRFVGCKQLQFILSVSTAISMPELRNLIISDCEELVSIIEDDKENQQNPFDPHHETCFPKLFRIEVKQCKKLKCLFSISTYPKLPRLRTLEIEDAPELVQVFDWKQGASQELVIKDVLPNLLGIRLVNLPSLHTIYQGIDIQTLKFRLVRNSGNIPSTNVSSSELFDSLASLHPDQMNFVGIEFFRTYNIIWKWARQRRSEEESEKALERDKTISEQNNNTLNLEDSEEASKEADEKDSAIQKQESSSQNLTERKEVSKKIVKNDSTTHKQNSNLSNLTESINASVSEIVEEKLSTTVSSNSNVNAETSKNEIVEEQLPASNAAATPSSKSNRSEELSKEITAEDSTTNINLPNLTKSTKTSANEIVEEKLSTTPSSDLDMNLKETFGEGPSSEKCGKSHGKESMDDDQQEKSRSSNEALQRIEEPTKEWSSKKTSNEVSLKIPPPLVTEMTSPLDPSIITLKKPPTAISTTQTEPKSSQSDMFDISINTECPQVEIMTNDKTCTDVEEMKFDQKSSSQIFEEHDLMRLFQMMKEGADMEVDLSYVSKLITDLHHNKEVTKALADLEASLKKGLNEIACSKESRIRLQNALNILSSHCSEGGASSHGLQDTIQSLQEEIQTVLSSFNQAYATIDKFTKLEQREKLMIEQRSQREKDAKTLLYDINTTKNSIAEVQLNEAELKEQISKLQAELRNKEEEIEEYERKLLSLQKQEKKSVSDTIGFTMEFMAMEKERSRMVEDQMKARQQLENMDAKWSSCLSNLKKTMILLGVHLKQKL